MRAEAAEAQLHTQEGQQSKEKTGIPSSLTSLTSKRRQRKHAGRTTGPLPKHLVSLFTFANRHNVSEQKVLAHVTMDIPLLKAVRGEWTDTDGTVITLALDRAGRAAFYQLYHDMPSFLECDQCPHQER